MVITIVKYRITPEADIAIVGLIYPVDSVKSTFIKKVLSCKRILVEKVQVNYFDPLKELIDSFKTDTVDAIVLEPCTLEQNLTLLKNVIVIRETVTNIGQCSISQASYPKTQLAALNGVPADLTDIVAATLKTFFITVTRLGFLPCFLTLQKLKLIKI